MEPVLYGPLVQMAEPLVKWAVEVSVWKTCRASCAAPPRLRPRLPTGPVFISLPGDILNSEAGIDLGRSTRSIRGCGRRTKRCSSDIQRI